MRLPHVVEVETFKITWNLNDVEQGLKVCITVERIKEFFERNQHKSGMGVEAIDENPDVGPTSLSVERTFTADLELSSFFNLG